MTQSGDPSHSELFDFDQRLHLTDTAHRLAAELGEPVSPIRTNFGRTLPYYAPIHQAIVEQAGELSQKAVLQIGAGTGLYTRYLQEKGVLAVALDYAEHSIHVARHVGNTRVVCSDVRYASRMAPGRALPFDDACFDVWFSDHFLFSNYKFLRSTGVSRKEASVRIVRDLHRLLKPKGIGILHISHEKEFAAQLEIVEAQYEIVMVREFKQPNVILDPDETSLYVLRKKVGREGSPYDPATSIGEADPMKRLACPACLGPFAFEPSRTKLSCPQCGRSYQVDQGVPILLLNKAESEPARPSPPRNATSPELAAEVAEIFKAIRRQPVPLSYEPKGAGNSDTAVRAWTDETGAIRVQATLIRCENGIVHLRRVNGQVISLSLDRLSPEDRQFIIDLAKGSG